MNAIAWLGTSIASCIVMFKAWQNLIATPRLSAKRAALFSSLLWFASALAVPLATLVLVPAAGLWLWLLVALATNGLLMMAVDGLLSRRKHSGARS
jgi:hypothetical protein